MVSISELREYVKERNFEIKIVDRYVGVKLPYPVEFWIDPKAIIAIVPYPYNEVKKWFPVIAEFSYVFPSKELLKSVRKSERNFGLITGFGYLKVNIEELKVSVDILYFIPLNIRELLDEYGLTSLLNLRGGVTKRGFITNYGVVILDFGEITIIYASAFETINVYIPPKAKIEAEKFEKLLEEELKAISEKYVGKYVYVGYGANEEAAKKLFPRYPIATETDISIDLEKAINKVLKIIEEGEEKRKKEIMPERKVDVEKILREASIEGLLEIWQNPVPYAHKYGISPDEVRKLVETELRSRGHPFCPIHNVPLIPRTIAGVLVFVCPVGRELYKIRDRKVIPLSPAEVERLYRLVERKIIEEAAAKVPKIEAEKREIRLEALPFRMPDYLKAWAEAPEDIKNYIPVFAELAMDLNFGIAHAEDFWNVEEILRRARASAYLLKKTNPARYEELKNKYKDLLPEDWFKFIFAW